MKKLNYVFIIFGILLIVAPFLMPFYSPFRAFLLLLGIIVLIIGLVIYMPRKLTKIIIYPIVMMVGLYTLDYFSFKMFKTLPILAQRKESSDKIKTYNSLFYRVYDCDGEIISDENYEKAFACDTISLEEFNVNELLTNSKESYKNYNGKFIKVIGKINTIVGNSSLVLNAYEQGEETVNGYVIFDEGKKVVAEELKIDPNKYHIYDYVEIVGLVSSYKEKDGTSSITLKDAKVIETDMYQSYELVVNNINSNEITKASENLYYMGLSGIYYRYSQDDIYELPYLLSDKRESIDNLVKDITPETINEENELYTLEEFKILKCANQDIYFLNKNIGYYNNICQTNEN